MAIDTSTFEGALQTKLDAVTDPKEMLLLGKALESTVGSIAVSDITTEGNTKVAAVNAEGTTQVSAVNSAGTTQVAAVNSIATNTFKTVGGENILGTGDINGGPVILYSGPVNGGGTSPSTTSTDYLSVCSFVMPVNKTSVELSGDWSYYNTQSSNGWSISRFKFVTSSGTLSGQPTNWDGHRSSGGSNGYNSHMGHGQSVQITGVPSGTTVTITLEHVKYNNSICYIYGAESHVTAIAY